jgi:hypothetical protein
MLGKKLLVLGRERGQRIDHSCVEILTDAGKVLAGPRQGERPEDR